MLLKKKVILITFCFIFFLQAKSDVWVTISSGSWDADEIWLGGVSPSFTNSDTIFIRNYIEIDNNIILNQQAFLQIDSNAALCGHFTVTVNSGATVLKYGLLELDILIIPGGDVILNRPGDVVLTSYGSISNGGSMQNNGCALSVGPWFDCRPAAMGFADISPLIKALAYPNPAINTLTIETPTAKVIYQLQDISGKVLLSGNVTADKFNLDISALSNGVYFLSLQTNEGRTTKKIEIVK